MALSLSQNELAEKQIKDYCKNKIPQDIQDQISMKYIIKANTIILIESRPKWNDKTVWTNLEIAKMKFDIKLKKWKLYYPRSNNKWYLYEDLKEKLEIKSLLQEIDKDPLCVFWG